MGLFYQQERNEDFLDVCEQVRHQSRNTYISVHEIVKQAVYMPAQSFYLTNNEFVKILKKIRTNQAWCTKSLAKKELYKEINRRYEKLKEEFPDITHSKIARILADQPAPRFYITEARALNLYYELLKQAAKTYI